MKSSSPRTRMHLCAGGGLWTAAVVILATLSTFIASASERQGLSRSVASAELRQVAEARLGHSITQWDFLALAAAADALQPELELARARGEVAQAGVITAGARPNPSLSLTPQVVAGPIPSGTSRAREGTYTASIDIPVETAGKRALRIGQASHLAESGRHQVEAARWMVRTKVHQAYNAAVAAHLRLVLLENSVATQQQISRLLEDRYAAGESARPEVTQARLLLNQLRLSMADAHRRQSEARAALATAVGVRRETLEELPLDFATFEQLPGVASVAGVSAVVNSRADVRSAEDEVAAAESALRLERAKRAPDLHVSPGYSRDADENKIELGLSFELPLFTRNQGPIAEATAKVREARARAAATQAQARGALEQALAGLNGARTKMKEAEKLMSEQQSQLASAQKLFESGATDRLSLLSAQVERDQVALLRLDALTELHQASAALEEAAQGPLAPPFR